MSASEVKKINVLIAEDSISQADYFKQLLSPERFRVKTLHNGKDTYLYLKENGNVIDVLLLDYRLPDMDGLEILEEIRGLKRNYGIIFISVDDSIDTIVKAMRAGAFDFISKHDNFEQELPNKIFKVYNYYHNKHQLKELRKQLAETELKFQTAFFSNPCSMVITRFRDGAFIEVNKIFINKLGYNREEVIGLNSIDLNLFIDPEQRSNFRNLLSRDGRVKDFEMKVKAKSGDIHTGLFSAEIIYLDSEACLLSIMTDITDRKKAEVELKEALNFNRSLVENFLHGLIILQDGMSVYANDRALGILKRKGQDLANYAMGWYKRLVYEPDLKVIRKQLKQLKDESVNDINFEIRVKTGSNEIIWLYIFISKISYNNNPALQLSFIDISDKKQAEHQHKKANEHSEFLFHFLPLPIITINNDGIITKFNQKTIEVTEYNEDEITTLFYNQLFYGLKEIIDTNEKDKFPIMGIEDRLSKKTGERIDVAINIDTLSDESPLGAGYILSFEDITEWKINNNKIIESEQKLKELNLTKDKFFSIIGHDLKNPFHTINGFSELLLKNFDQLNSKKLQQYIGVIYSTSKSGYELLQNLLEWANAQTGKLKVDLKHFELNRLIVENINFLGNVALKKGININFNPVTDSKAYADANMIQTVIRNLMSNAIKYSPRDNEIEIALTKSENKIVFCIKDNGNGIPSERLSTLFTLDKGYRSSPGTEGEDGTGLGLILCKEFIFKNNGDIWAESEEGKGSSFYFSLPVLEMKQT